MGVMDKLAFWKKKDDFDFGKDLGGDLGLGDLGSDLGKSPHHAATTPPDPGLGPSTHHPAHQAHGLNSHDLGMPEDTGLGGLGKTAPPSSNPVPMQQPFGSPPIQPQQPTEKDYAKDKFELVSAKLDSIRYTLESINQRLTNLERMAYGEHEKKKGW